MSALDTIEDIVRKLNLPEGFKDQNAIHFVNLNWLSACLKAGHIVDVIEAHKIPKQKDLVCIFAYNLCVYSIYFFCFYSFESFVAKQQL